MEQLTIDELKMYLGTGLQMVSTAKGKPAYNSVLKRRLKKIEILDCENINLLLFLKRKPLLKPLSDYKDINGEAMKELECEKYIKIVIRAIANNFCSWDAAGHYVIQFMAQNHIDFQDLIGQGKAIDINSLK